MADEITVTDRGNKEQFIIRFRGVDKGFNANEDFIGSKNVDNIKADTLVTVIKDVLIRLNIPLSNARGQCYDGAKNMRGIKNGVSNKILSENAKVFFIRCFGHALNLAVDDMVKNVRFLKTVWTQHTVFPILFKNLPKEMQCYGKFEKIYHLQDFLKMSYQDKQDILPRHFADVQKMS